MGDAHADERADVVAHPPGVEPRDVAEDRPALIQLADPIGDGGLRQPDRLGDLHLGGARVALQEIQDPIIYVIHEIQFTS